MKDKLKETAKYQLHSDCITDIVVEENQIITTSYDGTVCFTDRRIMKPFKVVETPTLCSQILRYKDKIYVAGLQAFTID